MFEKKYGQNINVFLMKVVWALPAPRKERHDTHQPRSLHTTDFCINRVVIRGVLKNIGFEGSQKMILKHCVFLSKVAQLRLAPRRAPRDTYEPRYLRIILLCAADPRFNVYYSLCKGFRSEAPAM